MLNVIEYGKDEYDFPALLVLGCFDAIHVGHRDLIKKAKLQAKINGLDLGVMLFRNGKGGKTVYSFEERLSILEEFNVKFVLAIDFTEEFKETSPEDFLHAIEEKVNVKAYMSGKDFRFGAKAKGKSSTLKNYAEDEENGVWYMPVKDVMIGEDKISTTQIKEYLENGNITAVNELLGSEFSVRGEVVKGAGRGASQLGYPTVNIVYPESKFPVKQGVYKVRSTIGDTVYFGIANFGNCPTFGDERIALEVNFEGFNGDLYGETLTISFLDYVRDIVMFASPEELAAQIKADKALLAADIVAYEEQEAAKAAAAAAAAAEHAAQQAPQPAAEAVAAKEPAQPVEDIEITPEEFKALDSGFGDVVEEPIEEIAAEEVPQSAVQPVVEEAQPEKAESVPEKVEEPAEEAVAEESVQPVEEVAENEEATEEKAEESAEEKIEEQQAEEVKQAAETVQEQPEEDIEIVGDGFDDVVEEPVEETATEESAQPTEEVAESEEATEEKAEEPAEEKIEEQSQPEEAAEVSAEESKPEENNGEDKID